MKSTLQREPKVPEAVNAIRVDKPLINGSLATLVCIHLLSSGSGNPRLTLKQSSCDEALHSGLLSHWTEEELEARLQLSVVQSVDSVTCGFARLNVRCIRLRSFIGERTTVCHTA